MSAAPNMVGRADGYRAKSAQSRRSPPGAFGAKQGGVLSMSRALVRGKILRVALSANGDPNDGSLRQELQKLQAAVESAKKDLDGAVGEKAKQKAKKKLEEAKERLENKTPPKDNTVVVTLAYPRSGETAVNCARALDIPATPKGSQEPGLDLSSKDFFEAGVFKEEIQDETILQVLVIDRDPKSKFGIALRAALAAVFGGVAEKAIGGISEIVVNKTAGLLAERLGENLKGNDKERVRGIAESAKALLRVKGDNSAPLIEVSAVGEGADLSFDPDAGVLRLPLRAPMDVVISEKIDATTKKQMREILPKGNPNGWIEIELTAGPF